MIRHRVCCFVLISFALAVSMTGCTTTLDTGSTPDESGELARRLEELGFDRQAASIVGTADVVEGQTATPYQHEDGRTALLVSDASAVELQALVFTASGELESTLYPDDPIAYYECLTCHAFYWSCYGACVIPCWSTDGLGVGCHTDCSYGCDYITIGYCEPSYCE